jgi:hypothetical protein
MGQKGTFVPGKEKSDMHGLKKNALRSLFYDSILAFSIA